VEAVRHEDVPGREVTVNALKAAAGQIIWIWRQIKSMSSVRGHELPPVHLLLDSALEETLSQRR
jgi:hypothetical protein